MPAIFELRPAPHADPIAVRAAVDALRAGRLVVFPTETVYGIASRADDPDATARLFEAKHRSPELGLPVMAATTDDALALARPVAGVRALATAFWPGPLTMVLRRSDRSLSWALGDRSDTIALRVPDHRVASAILVGAGPLAVSSANVSGSPPAMAGDELREAFGASVDVFLIDVAERPASTGAVSTVVELTSGMPHVIRPGAVDEAAIRAALTGGVGRRAAGHSVD